jgi:enoyl-CoA hydratase/carnithine racemase
MLRVESDGPVVNMVIDRPEVRNALSDGLIGEIGEAFASLSEFARVVILSGAGSVFCAGGDLKWMQDAANYTEEENYQDALRLGRMFEAIADCPAVVIAKVHGAAFGGGCGLVAASDVAVAAERTKFSFSEVRLGLIPATISPIVIPKIGHGHARHLFTTGEVFESDHAFYIGLVHKVVSEVDLDARVASVVKDVLQNGPKAVASAKHVAVHGPYPMEESARLLAKARSGFEGKEGVQAFLEKRKASFVEER